MKTGNKLPKLSYCCNIATFLVLWTLIVFASLLYILKQHDSMLQARASERADEAMQQVSFMLSFGKDSPGKITPRLGKDATFWDEVAANLERGNPYQFAGWMIRKRSNLEQDLKMRLVAINPLNPDNKADQWETRQLLAMKKGTMKIKTISQVVEEGKRPVKRVLKPLLVTYECFECHQYRNFKPGEVRGAVSVSIFLNKKKAAAQMALIGGVHFFVWLAGILGLTVCRRLTGKNKSDEKSDAEELRLMVEHSQSFDFWLTARGEIAFISPICKKITGYSRQDFLADPDLLKNIIHPDDRSSFEEHLRDFEGHEHDEVEYRIIAKDGSERWISHICSPVYIEGEFRGRRGSNRDITAAKKAYDLSIHSQKLDCLGRFAGGVAHDLNNVLASISTFVHLLQDELSDRKEIVESYITPISTACRLGKNYTANLTVFGGKQGLRLEYLNLAKVIKDIEPVIRMIFSDEVEVNVECPGSSDTVLADKSQMEQILINLCLNAKDAMPEGGQLAIKVDREKLTESLSAVMGAIPAANYVTLSVSDTGKGIKENNIKEIFKPFYSTKKSKHGTGIGLDVVKNIVNSHNGFIDVISKESSGTTVKIYLYLCNKAEGRDDSGGMYQLAGPTEGRQQAILLVDDDPLIRKSLQLLLQHEGYKIIAAEDGEEAVEKYQQCRNELGLVILDVILPRKNGKEVYSIIRADNPDLFVLFMSGYSNAILNEIKSNDRHVDFVSKPLHIEEFALQVKTILQNKS